MVALPRRSQVRWIAINPTHPDSSCSTGMAYYSAGMHWVVFCNLIDDPRVLIAERVRALVIMVALPRHCQVRWIAINPTHPDGYCSTGTAYCSTGMHWVVFCNLIDDPRVLIDE